MLLAKIAAPQAAHVALRQPVLDRAAEGVITLFTASAGYLLDDSLAAALAERSRPTLWLRLGPEDRDPATFLVSLINGARRLVPDAGTTTLEHMRRQPGPTAGWPPLFVGLGHELANTLPTSSTMVLENVHYLNDTHLTLAWLGSNLLPALRADITCILTSGKPLPRAALPAQTNYRSVADLRVDCGAALLLADHADARVPAACVRRAVVLTDGRAGALVGLCTACPALGSKFVERAVSHAAGVEDLLASLVRAWLATANANTWQALALAVRLEYSHPALMQAVLGEDAPPVGPWLQALTDSWVRVRRLWHTPLQAALHTKALPDSQALHRAADYLASQGAIEQAVPLYFELGDVTSAAQAIARSADALMNLGQWRTLADWLEQLPALLEARDRSYTPVAFNLSAPTPPTGILKTSQRMSLWNRLLATVGLRRPIASPLGTVAESGRPPVEEQPAVADARDSEHFASMLTRDMPTTTNDSMIVDALLATPDITPVATEPAETRVVEPSVPAIEASTVPTLTAHLLGTFRVSLNDQPVENWPSGRGRSVFKYLLIHHDQPTARDVLMDVFWPDAGPEAARNRLHVALHSLRQRLRKVADMPAVIFQDGTYCLYAGLQLWVDVDEFDRHVETGRRLEAAGQIAMAATEYELAIGLYQGDLSADDPYEEWPVLARERLRVAYLDTLDRLSHIYFSRGQYAACEALCQLILTRDNCREDAHCLLMRCYSRQDQHHLALRQYQACVEALRTELDVAPAPATTQLAERIRRRERV